MDELKTSLKGYKDWKPSVVCYDKECQTKEMMKHHIERRTSLPINQEDALLKLSDTSIAKSIYNEGQDHSNSI